MRNVLGKMRDALQNPAYLGSILSGKKYWEVAVDGLKIKLSFSTLLHYQIAREESEGKIERDILEYWLKIKADVVYDIGGYNGIYGIAYAKKYPNSRVIIFEPDLINYNQILQNIKLNDLANCTVEKVAVSDTEGTILFSQGGRSKERIVEKGGSPVPTFPLSYYPKAELVKIDVEGAEGKVLRGLMYPTNIIIELHSPQYLAQYGDTQESIWKRVKELNLTPVLLSDRNTEQHYFLHP
ncbi:FkbM family methyltransferase [Candidatus Kaiserbacteria bacterium]|nr:FkbM family methyltransferase [Candidatus Kaiserbacteria bacterium]